MSKQLDVDKIKKELLLFTQENVAKFLKENPDLIFYGFAFDCNADYAEVNLSFNTENSFEKTLHSYQTGRFAESYQTEEKIYDLKYNTGDWEYICFATIYVLTDEEAAEIYDFETEYEKQANDLMNLFGEVLLDFTLTDEFNNIPKTDDFKILCLDHDESIESAELRLNQIKHLRNSI